MNPTPRNRKLFLWPAAAIAIGALVSVNPFYAPDISLGQGIMAWCLGMALVLVCWAHPGAARFGVLLAGLFMAVPCFLNAAPLFRGWLMCGMFLPLILASIPVLAPSVTGFRARLMLLCSWDHTRELKRSPRHFYAGSLLQLFLATIVFATALDVVERIPAFGFWLPVRWLAGGVMILAFAEMLTASHIFLAGVFGITTPLLMESPILSKSISEFWNRRWNPGASFLLRRLCYDLVARRDPVLALFAVFVMSGVIHALLFYMAVLRWKIALINGAFFLVQPFFILLERQMGVRGWPTMAGRAWTLTVLGVTSPLFVEPVFQVIEPNVGFVWPATLIVVALATFMAGIFLGAALISGSKRVDFWSVLGYKTDDLVDKE